MLLILFRSRDSGNSVRSQSSGSSCEANHVSSARDSGIHSNGEELGRHAASPATTRRYRQILFHCSLLQIILYIQSNVAILMLTRPLQNLESSIIRLKGARG